jgi:hypothetical protein
LKTDKLEKLLCGIAIKRNLKAPDTISHLNKFDESSPLISFDEKALLKALKMSDQSMLTGKKWNYLRNKCIQHVVSGQSTLLFCDTFFPLLLKYDPKYYCEHKELLEFLHLYSSEKSDMKNVDIINRLSELHEKYATTTKAFSTSNERNETVIHQCMLIYLTQQFINNVIEKHGTGLIVNMRKTFSEICTKSGDFEILFILWRKLFER